jgi:LysM repeat protein
MNCTKNLLYILLYTITNTLYAQVPTTFSYVVKKQDKSLWQICHQFKTTVAEVKTINHKKDPIIHFQDTLQIPLHRDFLFHYVSPKDKSLWRICKQYNVSTQDIIDFNKKENSNIHPNELIIIPKVLIPLSNKKKTHLSYSLWQNLQCPLYDIQKEKFAYHKKKQFNLDSYTIDPKLQKISPFDYISIYQDRTQGPQQDGPTYFKPFLPMYYYSFESTFVMDSTLNKVCYPDAKQIKDGYIFNATTILEFDSVQNVINIRYLLHFHKYLKNTPPNNNSTSITLHKGQFACCYHSPVLASFQTTPDYEKKVYAELLSPLVIKQTTVIKTINKKTSTSVLILECSPLDSPLLLDEAHFKNGKLVEDFNNVDLRKKYNY